jgi:hypothetical protein
MGVGQIAQPPINIPGVDMSKLTENQQAMLTAQQSMADSGNAQSMALLAMQKQEAQRAEAIAALSTSMKNAHDSAMLVINNAKS